MLVTAALALLLLSGDPPEEGDWLETGGGDDFRTYIDRSSLRWAQTKATLKTRMDFLDPASEVRSVVAMMEIECPARTVTYLSFRGYFPGVAEPHETIPPENERPVSGVAPDSSLNGTYVAVCGKLAGTVDSGGAAGGQQRLREAMGEAIEPRIRNVFLPSDSPCFTEYAVYREGRGTPGDALKQPLKLNWSLASNVELVDDPQNENAFWRRWIRVEGPLIFWPIHVAEDRMEATLQAARDLIEAC